MINWSRRLQHLICTLVTILATTVPFVFCWLSDELFEFNKMLYVYAFTSVIACLCAARCLIEKRFIYKASPLNYALLAFLASQILATLFSMHPRTSWLGYYTRLNGGLLSTLAYLTLYYAYLTNFTPKARRRLLSCLLVASGLVSLYAIGEHYGHSFSCLIIKGNFDVSCWIQDVQTRVYATLGQPNWLAAYNVTIIGLATVLMPGIFRRGGFSLLKLIAPVSLTLNFMSLLFTRSRSGIIAFAGGLIVSVILLAIAWQKTEKSLRHQQIRVFVCTLACFLIPALIWGTQYTPSLGQLVTRSRAEEISMGLPAHLQGLNVGITDSADIRKIVWKGALDIYRHYPLLGTGVETFAYSYYQFRPADHNWTSEWDFLYNKAHNELLNFAANSGTLGLITYLSLFVMLAYLTIHHLLTKRDTPAYLTHSYWLIGICASLVALSITNFFGFSTVSVQVLMYLLFAAAASITASVQTADLAALADQKHYVVDQTWQKVSFVTLTIIGLFCLSQTWKTWSADYNFARCKSLITRTNAATAMEYCATAISLRPKEALYYIELGNYYAQYAAALAKQAPEYSSEITNLTNTGIAISDRGLALNPHNLNFYKTRYMTLSTLAQINPDLWPQVLADLEQAMRRSPTDPKLAFYYGQTLAATGDAAGARDYYERAVSLRPLYHEARLAAAKAALEAGDYTAARTHYLYLQAYSDYQDQAAAGLTQVATASGQLEEQP